RNISVCPGQAADSGVDLMNKSPFPLDLINVASPCPADWEKMTGDDRVRFCSQCNLHVYNLSDMPRAEAEAFVNQAEGRTCVRYFRREDGTILTRDCPVGLAGVRRRLARGIAALAGLVVALVTGAIFGSRLKSAAPAATSPASALAEWIEPGSTQHVWAIAGAIACPPPLAVPPPPPTNDTALEAPESPLPEPTAEQLQQIAERLQGEN
ncbi:MAG: hypothetical protein SFU86_06070, partial [Pirellulaceae bacterium]|nr:hypothetical protein [Pirellulaceae bacterium]